MSKWLWISFLILVSTGETGGVYMLVSDTIMEVADQETLAAILESCRNIEGILTFICGFLLFFVVVALCYFSYKFFKIFF